MEKRKFVTYIPGNRNIILASPHGGSGFLDIVPTRQNGCYDGRDCDWRYNCTDDRVRNKCVVNVYKDAYTREITEMIGEKIEQLSGGRPHIIHMDVHRRHVDVNRPKDEGAGNHPLAVEAWDEFHKTVKQVRKGMTKGIYFDIHGQRHTHGLLELGYRVGTQDLNTHNFSARDTSIRNLASRVTVNISLADLIWGVDGFGGMLEARGIGCMPSPSNPTPGDRKYYRGGYNTEEYGSANGGGVDAIQVEMPAWLRNAENATFAADALAHTILKYVNRYY